MSDDADADAVMASFDAPAPPSQDPSPNDKPAPSTTGDADADAVLKHLDETEGKSKEKRGPFSELHEMASVGYHNLLGNAGVLATSLYSPEAARNVAKWANTDAYHAPADDFNDTPMGRAIAEMHQGPPSIGDRLKGAAADMDAGPRTQAAAQMLGDAVPFGLVPRAPGETPYTGSQQSMGAARAAPDFSTAEPAVQAAAAKLTPRQIDAGRSALEAHAEAQSLRVPVRLTAGEATDNGALRSEERNMRAATGTDSSFYAPREKAINQNFTANREAAGPDVFTTNPVDHGEALINEYKQMDAPIKADVDAKYQTMRDEAQRLGIDDPIDLGKFVDNSNKALRAKLLQHDIPPKIQSLVKQFTADGDTMNFQDFEVFRSRLADEIRDNIGSERKAAMVMRDELEKLPLTGNAAALKPLADDARAAARARYQRIDADPAYAAALDGSVSPDRFTSKFLTGAGGDATREQVATMRKNLQGSDVAQQTISVAAHDALAEAAGVDVQGNGKVGPKRFSTRLAQLRNRQIFTGEDQGHLNALDNTLRRIYQQTDETSINNSNTFTAAAKKVATVGAKAIAAKVTGGASIPFTEVLDKKLEARALRKQAEKSTRPLAGVGDD